METQTVNFRIGELIQAEQINPNAFASQLGYKSAVIYNILKGRNKPSYDLLIKVCEVFKVSAAWLLMGIGSMYNENITNDTTIDKSVKTDLDVSEALKELSNSNLLYLEFHLRDTFLNLKLLQDKLLKKGFDKGEYEASQKISSDMVHGLKIVLQSNQLSSKALVNGLLKFDQGIRFYMDSIKELSTDLLVNLS